ncbi:hypothetical protein GALMADRAFT_245254 [Galerina marginata CBS 339.88]|uniref:Uncharacterized protein n=1 Tax=Galerina marginata (strain CBS 339.88) TaxID=685588 RepID=A0A067T4Z0_GALM3|nr:hypothetical protein GALMADRAFT_245254 [Galerina marginata CBS 339.88]
MVELDRLGDEKEDNEEGTITKEVEIAMVWIEIPAKDELSDEDIVEEINEDDEMAEVRSELDAPSRVVLAEEEPGVE